MLLVVAGPKRPQEKAIDVLAALAGAKAAFGCVFAEATMGNRQTAAAANSFKLLVILIELPLVLLRLQVLLEIYLRAFFARPLPVVNSPLQRSIPVLMSMRSSAFALL